MDELDELGGLAVPFRWDLASPDRLGSLLTGVDEPDLWFVDSLVACAGKVVTRGGDGDLFFVGRSLDSMFDLLSGALSGAAAPRVHRLPLSFARKGVPAGRRWQARPLDAGEMRQARRILAASGLAPQALARRSRPATFADVVHGGSTFTELFALLQDWIAEDRAQWDVIRRKLRFSAAGRTALARAISGEPGLAQPWLRSLVTNLSRNS
jgi:hypothetical protein